MGGAILPGVGMSAAALDDCTDALPRIVPLDTPPASIGANTEEAIRSGLFWGSFGDALRIVLVPFRCLNSCRLSGSVFFCCFGVGFGAHLAYFLASEIYLGVVMA